METGKLKELWTKPIARKIIVCILLLSLAMGSIFGLSKIMSNPDTYRSTIESIDEKKATVAGLTAVTTITSTALAAIPGDVTTPIADNILEMSTYLLLVVCILVLEKSLLTVFGWVACVGLIPAACVLFGVYQFFRRDKFKIFAAKLAVFAVVLVAMIPTSIYISDLIYDVNKSTIEEMSISSEDEVKIETEDKSWLESMLDTIKGGVKDIGEKAKEIMNKFIDSIAIFIITYCAIPIIVIFIMIWLVNLLFGLTIPQPDMRGMSKKLAGKAKKLRIKKKEKEIELIEK